VATVIYTHSLEPHIAVVYSGILNFVGVLLSSGAVAWAIVSLLPVELILKGNNGSGFAMVFALLVAAILWNLATWYRGLPVSSSHTMIGSILGVGLAYQLMRGNSGTSGLDWEQVKKVITALCVSPLVGFVAAGLVLLVFKLVAKDPRLFQAPKGSAPPPFYIRCLMILLCGGVSYAHGSNDGQKGMGLMMLILVGTVPTAYALNHTMGASQVQEFAVVSTQVAGALDHYVQPGTAAQDAGPELEKFVSSKKYEPGVTLALQEMVLEIRNETTQYGTLEGVPQGMQANVRNQMYLTSETLRLMAKSGGPQMSAADNMIVANYTVHSHLGEGCSSAGAGTGHYDRMEADRGDGGGEDRQGAHDLCAGGLGATGCHGDDPSGGHIRPSGIHNACAEFQRGGDDGGQPQRVAADHPAQHCGGVGLHAAGGGTAVGHALLDVQRAGEVEGLKEKA
jgi:PiT family inorganic phosphate transporter